MRQAYKQTHTQTNVRFAQARPNHRWSVLDTQSGAQARPNHRRSVLHLTHSQSCTKLQYVHTHSNSQRPHPLITLSIPEGAHPPSNEAWAPPLTPPPPPPQWGDTHNFGISGQQLTWHLHTPPSVHVAGRAGWGPGTRHTQETV